MNHLEKLIAEFESGNVISSDGSSLSFSGVLGNSDISLNEVETEIGEKLPSSISSFIKYFGGAQLYVDEYGGSFKILHANEIIDHNLEQQKTTEKFWPNFMIFGYSYSDDMLVFCKPEGKFGLLDHEAWGEPDVWRTEATSWYNFEQWLADFVRNKGDV